MAEILGVGMSAATMVLGVIINQTGYLTRFASLSAGVYRVVQHCVCLFEDSPAYAMSPVEVKDRDPLVCDDECYPPSSALLARTR